jgi:histidinol dehydrogenase
MINIVINPPESEWEQLTQRPQADFREVEQAVTAILDDVKRNGTSALVNYTAALDGYSGSKQMADENDFTAAEQNLDAVLKIAILQAAANIEKFHSAQLTTYQQVEIMPGVVCSKRALPIESVGLYIPGGSAPLFSTVLMLGIPARIAACKNVFLCTPPSQEGKVHPAILFAAKVAGIKQVYYAGGAQAIAAMAFGNAAIPKADKIFGPGNRYVTCAKSQVAAWGVAIDMPAGPSEVLVIADEQAVPRFVAADLLAQAEHGPDSQVICLCISEGMARAIKTETQDLLKQLPRKDIAEKALKYYRSLVLENIEQCIRFSNQYAPEHLILSVEKPEKWADKITHAGSVFLGNYSPESAGDYASGTNHTLPTNGFARAYSGVSVESFQKTITFQQLSQEGLQGLANTVIQMAEAEGLDAHALAIKVRMSNGQ